MKKTLLIAFALMLSAATFAQQQLATLNHNGEITVYYGQSALQSAHGAAVNGDIITLSPGNFNSVDITKAITIRGAGMFPDTAAGTEATTLTNNYSINVAEDSINNLYMEGIYNACDQVIYGDVHNPQFVKCFFKTVKGRNFNTSIIMFDAMFVNCIISVKFEGYTTSGGSMFMSQINTQFINSVIVNLDIANNLTPTSGPTLLNCVAYLKSDASVLNVSTFRNSILYYDYCRNTLVNAVSSFYCIGVNSKTSGDYVNNYYYYTTGLTDHHIYNYKGGLNTVFKNFRGSYSAGITFELLDNVAATCLGDDGTQVGIYGGFMPFDPRVRNPLIKKCNVARKSTVDGKLAVDIEVVSE